MWCLYFSTLSDDLLSQAADCEIQSSATSLCAMTVTGDRSSSSMMPSCHCLAVSGRCCAESLRHRPSLPPLCHRTTSASATGIAMLSYSSLVPLFGWCHAETRWSRVDKLCCSSHLSNMITAQRIQAWIYLIASRLRIHPWFSSFLHPLSPLPFLISSLSSWIPSASGSFPVLFCFFFPLPLTEFLTHPLGFLSSTLKLFPNSFFLFSLFFLLYPCHSIPTTTIFV